MQRRYTLMGRVPAVILLMSLAAWPMSSEAQNRRPRGDSGAGTSDPVDQLPDSSDNKDDKGSSSRILDLLELAASLGRGNEQGPESMGSVLNSVRLTNSIQSGQTELYKETHKATSDRVSPRIKYSHEFSEGGFVGLSFTSGLRNTDERNVVGSRGSYTTDTTQTKVTQAGIRVGSGPLNLLASSSSEFSFGYDQSVTTGPYATEAFRFPFYDPISKALTQTSVSAFLGYGNLHYHSQSYSLNFGFQGGGSFLGVYMMCGLALATGSLELTSYGQDITGLASAAVTRAPVQITYVKFKSVTGLLYTVEVGPVFKISDHLGVKVGGYYQLAALMLDKPSGYYYNQGTLSELSSSIEVTSTDKRHDYGFWGVTVGVVTGL